MNRRLRRWLLAVAAGFVGLLAAGSGWIVATESGTAWLFRQASAYLPDELELDPPTGTLLHGIHVAAVHWHDETVQVSLDDLVVNIELLPLFTGRVAVRALDVERVDVQLTATEAAEAPDPPAGLPEIDLPVDLSLAAASIRNLVIRGDDFVRTIDELRLAARVEGPDLELTEFRVLSAWLDITLAGHGRLAGRYPADIRSNWQWTVTDDLRLAGELQLEGDLRRYTLRHLLTGPVAVKTSGSLSYGADGPAVDLSNEWEALEWALADSRIQSPQGSLRLHGNLSSLTVALDTLARLDDHPETRLELDGTVAQQGMRIAQLQAGNELGRLEASGNATWLPVPTLDVAFELAGLNPSQLSEVMTGVVNLQGRLNGRIEGPASEAELSLERIGGTVNGHPLGGNAQLAYTGNTLTITAGQLELGANRVAVSGTVGASVALQADLDLAAIGQLLPGASGSIDARLDAQGPAAQPELQVSLDGAGLTWTRYSLETLSADARIAPNGVGEITLTLRELATDDRLVDLAQFSGSGQLDDHNFHLNIDSYGENLELTANGAYVPDRWEGHIDSLRLTGPSVGDWSIREPSELIVSAESVKLARTCLSDAGETGSACLEIEHADGDATSFDLALTTLPLSAIPATLTGELRPSGLLDARLRGRIESHDLSGDAEFEIRDAALGANYDGEPLSVTFTEAAGTARLAEGRLESSVRLELADGAGSANLALDIDGIVNGIMDDIADGNAAVTGRGDVAIRDLSLFAILAPGISTPRGRIDGVLEVSGKLGAPEFAGELELTDGAFGLRQTGIEVSAIDLRLQRHSAGHLKLEGSARSGAGQVAIRGDTRIGTDTGIRTELVVSGDNFELARLPDWRVAASPEISVVFDERAVSLSGELGIPSADLRIRNLPETAESPSPDAKVHRADGAATPAGRRIDVNVTTVLGDDVRFAGFGLTASIDGSVQLRGSTHTPYLGNGRLILRDGQYKAYGQELEIERGELIFNGPLDNPGLDIRAIRRSNDIVAGIQLSGTPARPRSELFSEPPLSDAETLSYVLTGRPLAGLSGTGQGDALNQAAFALGLSGASSIASQVRGKLGLETLTVEGGAEDGKIVAGKRFGDRLLIEYGYGLIDKLGTLLLRYQLTDRIVVESRTGTVNNVDVVYSVKKQ